MPRRFAESLAKDMDPSTGRRMRRPYGRSRVNRATHASPLRQITGQPGDACVAPTADHESAQIKSPLRSKVRNVRSS